MSSFLSGPILTSSEQPLYATRGRGVFLTPDLFFAAWQYESFCVYFYVSTARLWLSARCRIGPLKPAPKASMSQPMSTEAESNGGSDRASLRLMTLNGVTAHFPPHAPREPSILLLSHRPCLPPAVVTICSVALRSIFALDGG